jgi:hypothetical protein
MIASESLENVAAEVFRNVGPSIRAADKSRPKATPLMYVHVPITFDDNSLDVTQDNVGKIAFGYVTDTTPSFLRSSHRLELRARDHDWTTIVLLCFQFLNVEGVMSKEERQYRDFGRIKLGIERNKKIKPPMASLLYVVSWPNLLQSLTSSTHWSPTAVTKTFSTCAPQRFATAFKRTTSCLGQRRMQMDQCILYVADLEDNCGQVYALLDGQGLLNPDEALTGTEDEQHLAWQQKHLDCGRQPCNPPDAQWAEPELVLVWRNREKQVRVKRTAKRGSGRSQPSVPETSPPSETKEPSSETPSDSADALPLGFVLMRYDSHHRCLVIYSMFVREASEHGKTVLMYAYKTAQLYGATAMAIGRPTVKALATTPLYKDVAPSVGFVYVSSPTLLLQREVEPMSKGSLESKVPDASASGVSTSGIKNPRVSPSPLDFSASSVVASAKGTMELEE